jgi:tRNA modification GTPase
MRTATEQQSTAADLKLLCIDSTRDLSAWEVTELERPDDRRLVVGTKCDAQPNSPDLQPFAIRTSSLTGQGLAELKAVIATRLNARHSEYGAIAATADRCAESLRLAAEALQRAAEFATAASGDELIAAEVRLALEELGHVTGAIYTEDILDRVFSRFCIGK